MNTNSLIKKTLAQMVKMARYTMPAATLSVGQEIYAPLIDQIADILVAEKVYENKAAAKAAISTYIVNDNTDPFGIDAKFAGVYFDYVKTNRVGGQNNGTITFVNYGGGTVGAGYGFSIDNGSNWQERPEFTGLAAGPYTLMVVDGTMPAPLVSAAVPVVIS